MQGGDRLLDAVAGELKIPKAPIHYDYHHVYVSSLLSLLLVNDNNYTTEYYSYYYHYSY